MKVSVDLFLVICLFSNVGFSFAESHELQSEKVKTNKGYLTHKLLSKFQSFKNYISLPINGPVLYKPYLNYNPQHQLGNGYGQKEGNPSDMRKDESQFPIIRNWKKQKKQNLKETLITKMESDQTAAEALAQRKQMAMLRHHHMHGVVDTYRPQGHVVSLPGLSNPWWWKQQAAPSHPKPKQKKKPNIKKKPQKKKKKTSEKGFGIQESVPVSSLGGRGSETPIKSKPKKKLKKVNVKKKKTKTRMSEVFGGKLEVSPEVSKKKVVGSIDGGVENIYPTAGSGTTTSGFPVYPKAAPSTYKIKSKKLKENNFLEIKVKEDKMEEHKVTETKLKENKIKERTLKTRINSKRVDEKSIFDFARRTLDSLGSDSVEESKFDKTVDDSGSSFEIVSHHNLQQRRRHTPTRVSTWLGPFREEPSPEYKMNKEMEPRHELHFRRMPFIHEERL